MEINQSITLHQLISYIEKEIVNNNFDNFSENINFKKLLLLYDSNLRDLLPYTFIELNKNYTRNLISTDYNNYTLILICWNPKRESPIHNHPCQGCWFRIIKGNIYEKLFTITPKDNYLSIVEEKHYKEGDVSFIDDTIALHKVGNLTDEIAMTLHLYMPPIDNCKIWFDENDKKSIVVKNTFHSKEGKMLKNVL